MRREEKLDISYSTGNPIVDQVGEINISGNVVPITWYQTMIGKSGKPMLLAINLLADIVYWYRPKEIRDEGTGSLVGFQKRFKADLLQRSYRQIENRFGVTKKQARSALDFLNEIGVIKKHLRNEKTPEGVKLHNSMYLELVPEKLIELTFPKSDEGVPFKESLSANKSTRVISERAVSSDIKETTYTENTTNTTTSDYHNHIGLEIDKVEEMEIYQEIIKENISYDELIKENNGWDKNMIDEIVNLMVETVSIKRKNISINGTDFPYEVVKSQFLKLKSEHIGYVLECMKNTTTKVNNIRSYLLTVLYNSRNTIDSYYQAEVNHDLYG